MIKFEDVKPGMITKIGKAHDTDSTMVFLYHTKTNDYIVQTVFEYGDDGIFVGTERTSKDKFISMESEVEVDHTALREAIKMCFEPGAEYINFTGNEKIRQ